MVEYNTTVRPTIGRWHVSAAIPGGTARLAGISNISKPVIRLGFFNLYSVDRPASLRSLPPISPSQTSADHNIKQEILLPTMRAHQAYSLLLALYASGVQGDGIGLIGWGKTMYHPTCTFACRSVIRKQQLDCTPVESTENHGTSHNPVATPPECFVKDPAFLKTMALCIDTYCPLSGDPPASLIEDYWASHLGTGTVGDYQFVPTISYEEALSAARKDESHASDNTNSTSGSETSHDHAHKMLKARQHDGSDDEEELDVVTFDVSSPLPITTGDSEPLNETSFVDPVEWQLQYNYLSDFETNESGHSTMAWVQSHQH